MNDVKDLQEDVSRVQNQDFSSNSKMSGLIQKKSWGIENLDINFQISEVFKNIMYSEIK